MYLTTILSTFFLLTLPISASRCRNFTNTYFSTESNRQFSTVNSYVLDRIECPRNDTRGAPGCPVPRVVHNITATRFINTTVSSEDEDAIFELARVGYWSRNLANNESLWDKAWDDKQRSVDLRSREWSASVLEARPGWNYTLSFVSYTRGAIGTLGGCDNETLNGMGVELRVPYLENNTVPENQTVVAGTLIGSGRNLTADGDGSGGGGGAGNGTGGENGAVILNKSSAGLLIAIGLTIVMLLL